jgi:hypothetical protein
MLKPRVIQKIVTKIPQSRIHIEVGGPERCSKSNRTLGETGRYRSIEYQCEMCLIRQDQETNSLFLLKKNVPKEGRNYCTRRPED